MANKRIVGNAKSRRRQAVRAEPETFELDSLPTPEEVPAGREPAKETVEKVIDNKYAAPGESMSEATKRLSDAAVTVEQLQAELERRQKAEAEAKEEALRKPPQGAELTTLKQIQETLSGCSLHWTWMGTVRKVKRDVNEKAAKAIGSSAKVTKVSREIIDTDMKEWKDLTALKTNTNARYDFITFDYVIKGQRLFRRDMKEEVWALVAESQDKLREYAARFQAKRDQIIEWAKKELGDAYDAGLYPTDLSREFSLSIREHSIEPPSYLRHTNAEEYQQHLLVKLGDIRNSMMKFESQCQQEIGRSVGNLVRALTDGTKLHGSNLENVQEVFQRIARMKFEGTRAFNAIMEDAKNTIEGVKIEDLKRSGGARRETKERLASLIKRYAELRQMPNAE